MRLLIIPNRENLCYHGLETRAVVANDPGLSTVDPPRSRQGGPNLAGTFYRYQLGSNRYKILDIG